MKDQYKELKDDILDEEKAIEETLERLYQARRNFNLQKEDYLTAPAMGTYLMNFYNGIENILRHISKEYYLTIPRGKNWHKELLLLSSNPPTGKSPIFTHELVERIAPYRNFRHRFISGYGFKLKGEKMLELIDNIKPLWTDIRKSISEFWDKL